jgi:F-type H+-transporting ATPase subunit a
MAHDPVDHVVDTSEWEIFTSLLGDPVHVHLPVINLFGYPFQITKYMILELIAAGLILLIFIPLARRARDGAPPKGAWWNVFEGILTFIRDEVAVPNMGAHHADRFVPFLWTVFLFILFCNLLGMIPWMGSPTASIAVTGALAVISFVLMHGAPIASYGVGKYLKSMWLDTGLPWYAEVVISGMIFVIEMLGTLIKSFVLSVRLFANMFAGHMVLAMILLFIVVAGHAVQDNQMSFGLWPVITVSSILGVVALSLLELFVAFLQAYVFTFLTALFVGMALHHAEEHGEHHGEHGGHGEHAGHDHHAGHPGHAAQAASH